MPFPQSIPIVGVGVLVGAPGGGVGVGAHLYTQALPVLEAQSV